MDITDQEIREKLRRGACAFVGVTLYECKGMTAGEIFCKYLFNPLLENKSEVSVKRSKKFIDTDKS